MSEQVAIYWLNYDGEIEPGPERILKPGEECIIDTKVNHVWIVRGCDERQLYRVNAELGKKV